MPHILQAPANGAASPDAGKAAPARITGQSVPQQTASAADPFSPAPQQTAAPPAGAIAPPLLGWFAAHRRSLPFRQQPSPYRVWVSEIMLQQTRVTAVLPYYERFLAALPDIPALAGCGQEKLHKLWEGLGYYNRVRNLQKAARLVMERYGGQLPADYDALRGLPGIGEYTAGAIASICFGLPVPAVDGNVLRVFSRLYADSRNILDPAVKKEFTARVMAHQPPDAPGPYNEALMELGALVCLPNGEPLCAECPLAGLCAARAAGCQQSLPVKSRPGPRRLQQVTVLAVFSPAGVLLQRRPDEGLLAGLWQPLLAERGMTAPEARALLDALGLENAQPLGPLPAARHIFTHIEWRMAGWQYRCPQLPKAPLPKGLCWASRQQLQAELALPGAFRAYRPLLLSGCPQP